MALTRKRTLFMLFGLLALGMFVDIEITSRLVDSFLAPSSPGRRLAHEIDSQGHASLARYVRVIWLVLPGIVIGLIAGTAIGFFARTKDHKTFAVAFAMGFSFMSWLWCEIETNFVWLREATTGTSPLLFTLGYFSKLLLKAGSVLAGDYLVSKSLQTRRHGFPVQ